MINIFTKELLSNYFAWEVSAGNGMAINICPYDENGELELDPVSWGQAVGRRGSRESLDGPGIDGK